MAEAGWFKSRTWSHVVLDEGHRIKGSATLIATALQGIGADHRLILTGTPVQNNLSELWSLLRWLFPNVFTPPTQKAFQAASVVASAISVWLWLPIPCIGRFDLARGSYNQDFLKAAMKLLDLVMLRRTKESVHKSITIPPREEITRASHFSLAGELNLKDLPRSRSLRTSIALSTFLDEALAAQAG